jgi:penicillin-binding protein 1C
LFCSFEVDLKGHNLNKTISKKYILIVFAGLLLLFLASGIFVPKPMFRSAYSTVLESNNGQLLGARIAADEQWRFPAVDSVPFKYERCVLNFEDRYFYQHPGINLVSIARAFVQNIKAGSIVSGGSTVTMQVCRLARGQKSRSVKNKLVEMVWALHLELRMSKSEILNLYASHAPFGGNVVGLDAAAWRYFGRDSYQLSWAESATLAVLPNAPSLIYPGRLDQKLKLKRDGLLKKLLIRNEIDSLTYDLAVMEPLPEKVNALPNIAYHLVQKAVAEEKGKRIRSTIDVVLQEQVNAIVQKHHSIQKGNHVNNIAVIVAEISTKKVRAYVGNVIGKDSLLHGNLVDVIQAERSSGSILKPFLYCKMLDEGVLTPKMLIPDIPVRLGGFTPVNFDREYNGAVPAEEALARSLNIPAVHLLREFGVAPFHSFLKKTGMSTLSHHPDYYGLSLILGGAEVKLWDLTGMYTSLAAILKTYNDEDGLYISDPFAKLVWKENHQEESGKLVLNQPIIRAASVYSTLDALLKVKRPESEAGWENFAASKKIAWKTGTSFGFRDAWAVGVSSKYVVAVWVGNADGEGRPGLTGVSSAAPVLFDVFSCLPASSWFAVPEDEMDEIEVCAQSGYLPGENCDEHKTVLVPSGNKVGICPWHQKIHLTEDGFYRVNASCYPVAKMQHRNFFVLPPAIEYYYKRNNALYSTLPPLLSGCMEMEQQMEFIYPREWNKLFIPVDLDGTPGKLIFDLAHRQNSVGVYWYLDEKFLGKTNGIHQLEIRPEAGWHKITVNDNLGNSIGKNFMVVNKRELHD